MVDQPVESVGPRVPRGEISRICAGLDEHVLEALERGFLVGQKRRRRVSRGDAEPPVLGELDGERLSLREVQRFANRPVRTHARLQWDLLGP